VDVINQILEDLLQQGINLAINGDNLRVQAPKALLTDDLRQTLHQHKAELLLLLKEQEGKDSVGLNLAQEAILEQSIFPNLPFQSSQTSLDRIFITGATGFLGAFLVAELLQQTSASLFCLVRAADFSAGYQRLQDNLQAYGLWNIAYANRLIPILGDLSQTRWGLPEQEFQQLTEQIDIIYHSAALLNWIYPYEALKSINVLGTQEVLRFACLNKTKPVHYISTTAVFESSVYAGKILREQDRPEDSKGIYLGYSQSKWVAEQFMLQARDRGLPVTIYRAPLISGHSQTGAWYTDDVTCRMIKGCIQLGSFPDLDFRLELAPVDYVSRSIAYLSQQSTSLGNTFHLVNPQPTGLAQLVMWLQVGGYDVKTLPYSEWVTQLRQYATSKNNALHPLLPFFIKRRSFGLTLPELYQQAYKPRLTCQATLAALQETDIGCPSIDNTLLETYMSYFIHNQFLKSPIVVES
jgi:thioester reductase-like protein